jgi:ubiquinone/menaquinone biosynthesis C-methylase UbiE
VSFDSIAPAYRTLETIAFGGDLQRARVACLGEIGAPRRALIIGEGNGRFLCKLLRRHEQVEVDCVDASGRMLKLARQRLERRLPADATRVHFIHQNITSWSPPEASYDLIATHFFLDCFAGDRLADVVAKLSRAATSSATWLLADFCLPTGGFARIRARLWLAAMYRFFHFTAGIEARELEDPSPFLRTAGFALVSQHLFGCGMVKSEIWRNTGILPVRPADMMSAARTSAG